MTVLEALYRLEAGDQSWVIPMPDTALEFQRIDRVQWARDFAWQRECVDLGWLDLGGEA